VGPGGRPVFGVHQVHGATVLGVSSGVGAVPPASTYGQWALERDNGLPDADAVILQGGEACAAVLSADCGSIALGSPEGIVAAVHAGWRGLVAGVVDRAVHGLRDAGASKVVAGLGPCIHPCCYAFSPEDLDEVAAALSPRVRGLTRDARPALDLPAGLREALTRAGAQLVPGLDACTGCDPRWYSHRARSEEERQSLLVWAGE
jgi:hypothetical protein